MPSKSKMKIALITPHFEPIIGGTPTVVYNIAKELAKLGNKVEVFTPAYSKKEKLKDKKENFTITRTKWKGKLLSNLLFHLEIFPRLKEFDIIHSFHPYFGLSGYLASKIYGKKLFISLMGWDTYTPLKKTGFFLKQIMKIFSKKAEITFSPSKELKKRALQQGLKEKIIVIPHGVNLKKIKLNKQEKEKKKKRLGISGKFIFLVVERLHPVKDPIFLLDAWKESNLQNACLLIAGKGKLYNKMQNKIRKEGMKNVKMLGFVDPKKIDELYAISNAIIHYSLYESFGLILLEAMKYGLPVIATKVGAIPEIVSDKEGRLIELKDKLLFKKAILNVMENKKKYNDLSKNCLKKIKKYEWNKIIKDYIKNYEK